MGGHVVLDTVGKRTRHGFEPKLEIGVRTARVGGLRHTKHGGETVVGCHHGIGTVIIAYQGHLLFGEDGLQLLIGTKCPCV